MLLLSYLSRYYLAAIVTWTSFSILEFIPRGFDQ